MNICGIDCSDVSVNEIGIEHGDLYMAKRNTDWQLFECNKYARIVVYPKGIAYPFNDYECFKVLK